MLLHYPVLPKIHATAGIANGQGLLFNPLLTALTAESKSVGTVVICA